MKGEIIKKEEKGASLVEYTLLVALIAIIAIVSVKMLGETVSTKFSEVADNFDSNT